MHSTDRSMNFSSALLTFFLSLKSFDFYWLKIQTIDSNIDHIVQYTFRTSIVDIRTKINSSRNWKVRCLLLTAEYTMRFQLKIRNLYSTMISTFQQCLWNFVQLIIEKNKTWFCEKQVVYRFNVNHLYAVKSITTVHNRSFILTKYFEVHVYIS